jgi:hypothetical protein
MDILYHYCSTASFHAIAQSHSLWLSSLSLSNDTLEGKVVATALMRVAKKHLLDEYSIKRLHDAIEGFEQIVDGLGFCLSEDGDLLSQWRGYAADATGVAIGFSTTYLRWLSETFKLRKEPSFTLQKVEYEPSAHESLVEPTYHKAKVFIEAGAFKWSRPRTLLDNRTDEEVEHEKEAIQIVNSELFQALQPLSSKLYQLKAYAFREEREWRLFSYLMKGRKNLCLYRAPQDRIIPYRKFELIELERNPITEVVLGPKHGTPPKVVEDFLSQNGYGAVQVRRSEGSYR